MTVASKSVRASGSERSRLRSLLLRRSKVKHRQRIRRLCSCSPPSGRSERMLELADSARALPDEADPRAKRQIGCQRPREVERHAQAGLPPGLWSELRDQPVDLGQPVHVFAGFGGGDSRPKYRVRAIDVAGRHMRLSEYRQVLWAAQLRSIAREAFERRRPAPRSLLRVRCDRARRGLPILLPVVRETLYFSHTGRRGPRPGGHLVLLSPRQ